MARSESRVFALLMVTLMIVMVGGSAVVGPSTYHLPNETAYPVNEIWDVAFPSSTNISCLTALWLVQGDGITKWYYYPNVTIDTGAINCTLGSNGRMTFNVSNIATTKYIYSGVNKSYDSSASGLYYYNYQYNFTNGTVWISPTYLFARPYSESPVSVRLFYSVQSVSWDNATFTYTPSTEYKPFMPVGSAIGLVNADDANDTYCQPYSGASSFFPVTMTGALYDVYFIQNFNCATLPDPTDVHTYRLGQIKGGAYLIADFLVSNAFEKPKTPSYDTNNNQIANYFWVIIRVAVVIVMLAIIVASAVLSQGHWIVPVIVTIGMMVIFMILASAGLGVL